MAIAFVCRCGRKMQAPEHLAGKSIACRACGAAVQIPSAAAAAELARFDEALLGPQTAVRMCPHCKSMVSATASACLQCGANLQSGLAAGPAARSAPQPVREKSSGSSIKEQLSGIVIAGGGIAALVALAIFGFTWIRGGLAASNSRSAADILLRQSPLKPDVLASRGPDAVPALIDDVKNPAGGNAAKAAALLGQIGPPAESAIPALRSALGAADISLPAAAAGSLGKLKAKDAVPELIAALQHKSAEVRGAAACSLGQIGGPDAAAALEQLIAMLKNDSAARPAIAEGLGYFGKAAKGAVPDLIAAIDSNDPPGMNQAAALALGRIGTADERVLPALVKALEDSEMLIAASEAIGMMGPAARSATPDLIDALPRAEEAYLMRLASLPVAGNERATADASRAGRTPPTEVVAVETVLSRVADGELAAVVAGLKKQQAAPVLAGLKSKDPIVRQLAAAALVQWKNPTPLMTALSDADPQVRQAVLEAAGKASKGQRLSLVRVLAALKPGDKEGKLSPAEGLMRLQQLGAELLGQDPGDKESQQALEELLKEALGEKP